MQNILPISFICLFIFAPAPKNGSRARRRRWMERCGCYGDAQTDGRPVPSGVSVLRTVARSGIVCSECGDARGRIKGPHRRTATVMRQIKRKGSPFKRLVFIALLRDFDGRTAALILLPNTVLYYFT